jgi:hypothetical protein
MLEIDVDVGRLPPLLGRKRVNSRLFSTGSIAG